MNLTGGANRKRKNLESGVPSRERGQIVPLAVLSLGVFICMTGFVIDGARVFIGFQQLQASTDAAALAGGAGLATSGTAAVNDANAFSSTSGNNNVYGNLPNVTMVSGYPAVKCIPYAALAITCDGVTTYNAIQVRQQVTVPTTFLNYFGFPGATLEAAATAASKGSPSTPYNIAMIIDTTASMGGGGSDSCTDPTNNLKYTTSIACALVGAKILLLNTAPCAADLSTCPGTASSSVDMVSIFTFPNGSASTMANDYSNGCLGPTIASTYSFPISGASSYAPTGSAADYQVTSFLSDYRTNDAATTLSSSSYLTATIGQKTGCAGMQTPGGLGTYYAGALIAAQDALVAQQALSGRTGSQNAIVLLSDGDAQATKMAAKDLNNNTVSTTAYTYPSTINECQQAINAASIIKATGTKIYSVAYGSPTSGGCATDTSGPNKGISPCSTMSQIASNSTTFFADKPAGSTSGCSSASSQNNTSSLSTIFGAIAADLTKARLIPNAMWTATSGPL